MVTQDMVEIGNVLYIALMLIHEGELYGYEHVEELRSWEPISTIRRWARQHLRHG